MAQIENLRKESNLIAEAKREGHEFIKVYLHPRAPGNSNGPIRFTGCVELKGSMAGIGPQAKYSFREIKGGTFEFHYEESEHEWICWLFDDKQKGSFSPIGYNRDLLAGHLGQKIFVVKDTMVYSDLKRRAEYLAENRKSIRMHKDELKMKLDVNMSTSSVEENVREIEEHMEFLNNRKQQLLNFENSKTEEQKKMDDDYNSMKNTEANTLNEQLNDPPKLTPQQKAAKTRAENKKAKEEADAKAKADAEADAQNKEGNLVNA